MNYVVTGASRGIGLEFVRQLVRTTATGYFQLTDAYTERHTGEPSFRPYSK